MNLDEFTPGNNGAGQLNQGQIIGGFFLKTNEQFAKAVEKRVYDLNDPAACMEIRIAPTPSFPRRGTEYEAYSPVPAPFLHCPCSLRPNTDFVGGLPPVPDGKSRICSRVASNSLTSGVLAPDSTTDSGRPFSSVRTLRFVPIFSSVRWILSNGLLCQRCLYHTAIQALPRPADFFYFIILFQTFGPDLLKKSRCQPFLKCSVYRAAAAVLPWQCLPLTARSQHIEYPLQRFPRWHPLASLTRSMDIVFLCIPLRFRNFVLDLFPKFIRYCP